MGSFLRAITPETRFFRLLSLFPEGNLRLTAGRTRRFFVFSLFLFFRLGGQHALFEEHLLEGFGHRGFDIISLPRQRIGESQFVGVKPETLDGISRLSVFIIADDVMSLGAELDADLVLPARIKSDI